MTYASLLVSLSSAGLQKLLSICDEYCASHSITFNVKKSVCMFFKCTVNKHCEHSTVFLSGNQIDFVQEVKYCIVWYCIMRPYTDGPIGPLSYRHSSGVVRNPHSTLAK